MKVRDEVQHLLDHNENMAELHLSWKPTKTLQDQALLASGAINSNFPSQTSLARPNPIINQAMGIVTSVPLDTDAGNLEMLLESYFMQLDGIRNRIVMVCSFLSPKHVLHLHRLSLRLHIPHTLSYFGNLCLFTIIPPSPSPIHHVEDFSCLLWSKLVKMESLVHFLCTFHSKLLQFHWTDRNLAFCLSRGL